MGFVDYFFTLVEDQSVVPPDPELLVVSPNNCPIWEYTEDNVSVGRCWIWLGDDDHCSRHGDVSEAAEHYRKTGRLTDEPGYGPE